MQTDVLVVGAGPVGLTLALDLGRRGVNCLLIEQKAAPEFLPKMERCNARGCRPAFPWTCSSCLR